MTVLTLKAKGTLVLLADQGCKQTKKLTWIYIGTSQSTSANPLKNPLRTWCCVKPPSHAAREGRSGGSWRGVHWVWWWEAQCVRVCMGGWVSVFSWLKSPGCGTLNCMTDRIQIGRLMECVSNQRERGRTVITLGKRMPLHQGHISDSFERRKR